MKKVVELFMGLAMLFMVAVEVRAAQGTIVLTETTPDTIVSAEATDRVYGTSGVNQVTIESGAVAELINFPGNNTVTIQSESNLFTVFRSGAYVSFEGTDGTVLKIPATTTSQSIVFNDGTYFLIIDSNRVMLGDQEINLTPVAILPVSSGDVTTNSLGMTFVKIQPGTFMMGSPEDELGRDSNETQHQVTLTQGYYMQTTEVTQGQWAAVMGSNPSSFSSCGDECPVEQVSWDDVQEFITKMNQRGEGTYSLPTEAQWEYAARAGSSTAFANGKITVTGSGYESNLDTMGWYNYNSDSETHPVARKQANAWDLYDMYGNVKEWCQDWFGNYSSGAVSDPEGPSSGSDRVYRGGCWYDDARSCRSAFRYFYSPGYRSSSLGFRLVFSPVSSKEYSWEETIIFQRIPVSPHASSISDGSDIFILDGKNTIYLMDLNNNFKLYSKYEGLEINAIGWQKSNKRLIAATEKGIFSLYPDSSYNILNDTINVSTLDISQSDGAIYSSHWSEGSSIYYCDQDGNNLKTIRTDIQGCSQIQYDESIDRIYYSETYIGEVNSYSLTEGIEINLVSDIGIPGTEEAIGVGFDGSGTLYYYTAMVMFNENYGLWEYDGNNFIKIMEPQTGMGSLLWDENRESFLLCASDGGIGRYNTLTSEFSQLLTRVNYPCLGQKIDGTILLGIGTSLYEVTASGLSIYDDRFTDNCRYMRLDKKGRLFLAVDGDNGTKIYNISEDINELTGYFTTEHLITISYDYKNDCLIAFTESSLTTSIWKIPVENPENYTKINSYPSNHIIGTVDRDGNIYILDRDKNSFLKIPDGGEDSTIFIPNIIQSDVIDIPQILYFSPMDSIILCRNDDLQAWSLTTQSSSVFAFNKSGGLDNTGLFETHDGQLLGTRAGLVYKYIKVVPE